MPSTRSSPPHGSSSLESGRKIPAKPVQQVEVEERCWKLLNDENANQKKLLAKQKLKVEDANLSMSRMSKELAEANLLIAAAAKSAALNLKAVVEAAATAAVAATVAATKAEAEAKDLHNKALEKVRSPSIWVYIQYIPA